MQILLACLKYVLVLKGAHLTGPRRPMCPSDRRRVNMWRFGHATSHRARTASPQILTKSRVEGHVCH